MLPLHYTDVLEQVTGLEPALSTWQADVLTFVRYLRLGTQSGDRTHDFLLVRQALSQAELSGYGALLLRRRFEEPVVDHTGIEPAISSLQNSCHPIATSGPYLACVAFLSLRP